MSRGNSKFLGEEVGGCRGLSSGRGRVGCVFGGFTLSQCNWFFALRSTSGHLACACAGDVMFQDPTHTATIPGLLLQRAVFGLNASRPNETLARGAACLPKHRPEQYCRWWSISRGGPQARHEAQREPLISLVCAAALGRQQYQLTNFIIHIPPLALLTRTHHCPAGRVRAGHVGAP